jgi:DNA-binding transcriptional ArsR family regulator
MAKPVCEPDEHARRRPHRGRPTERSLERAAGMFRALGDPNRLRLMEQMLDGEVCVTELAAAGNAGLSTVSQQLRVLRSEGLVARRRAGKHVFYSLADEHVADLVANALAHAAEPPAHGPGTIERKPAMSTCNAHSGHAHAHGTGCGHTAVEHEGHVDYLHDGHLHHPHGDHVDEHKFAVGGKNPDACTPGHACGAHDAAHTHGPGCGHEAVPHGDHADYLVAGHLHHPHSGHCDDHGPVLVK